MPKNIVMMTMCMDIGGAETHIFELSRELTERGHNVTVFSARGRYVDELEKLGIRHIYAPFRSKNPVALFKAYKNLDGVNGDVAGYALTISEFCGVLALALL